MLYRTRVGVRHLTRVVMSRVFLIALLLIDVVAALVVSGTPLRTAGAISVRCKSLALKASDESPAADLPLPQRSEPLPSPLPPACDYPGCVDGRVMGGLAAIDAFQWWPIKVTRPHTSVATPQSLSDSV